MPKGISRDNVEWNEADLKRMRQFWADGHSMTEIGRRLNRSKNSICGKVHRLGLPSRGSPIKPGSGKPRVKRAPAKTLPTFPAAVVARSAASVARRETLAASMPAPVRFGPASACCWPLGEPRAAGFRFCDAASVPGRSYCAEHSAIAYVRVRDRREQVA